MQYERPPKIMTDAGLSIFVFSDDFWTIDLPIIEVPIADLLWHFEMPVWEKDGTDDWNLTPWEVIKNNKGSMDHRERIRGVDTSFPIILCEFNSRYVVLDGMHRLVKLYEAGEKMVRVKIIPPHLLTLREFKK